ncbi:MAG: transposase, partial [Thermaerobacter sp.]|nr:transposase [Thermaerobacter sp.]
QKPQGRALKKPFNGLNYQPFPWLHDIHRDAHAEPFADLADAWQRCFTRQNDRPGFKKKGKTPDSFFVANDKFQIAQRRVKLPKIGWVRWRESLRFPGKIFGARVVGEGDSWFLVVQVSVPDAVYDRTRTANGLEGVDVGVKTFATLSTGEKITGPQSHRKAWRRLKMRQRAITRKLQAAKTSIGLTPRDPLPQGTRLPRSRNGDKAKISVARTHLRIASSPRFLAQDILSALPRKPSDRDRNAIRARNAGQSSFTPGRGRSGVRTILHPTQVQSPTV